MGSRRYAVPRLPTPTPQHPIFITSCGLNKAKVILSAAKNLPRLTQQHPIATHLDPRPHPAQPWIPASAGKTGQSTEPCSSCRTSIRYPWWGVRAGPLMLPLQRIPHLSSWESVVVVRANQPAHGLASRPTTGATPIRTHGARAGRGTPPQNPIPPPFDIHTNICSIINIESCNVKHSR